MLKFFLLWLFIIQHSGVYALQADQQSSRNITPEEESQALRDGIDTYTHEKEHQAEITAYIQEKKRHARATAKNANRTSLSQENLVVERQDFRNNSIGLEREKRHSSKGKIPCAENGSCYGDISPNTGRPKTIQVNGYHRRDGTYVRGHYRSHR